MKTKVISAKVVFSTPRRIMFELADEIDVICKKRNGFGSVIDEAEDASLQPTKWVSVTAADIRLNKANYGIMFNACLMSNNNVLDNNVLVALLGSTINVTADTVPAGTEYEDADGTTKATEHDGSKITIKVMSENPVSVKMALTAISIKNSMK